MCIYMHIADQISVLKKIVIGFVSYGLHVSIYFASQSYKYPIFSFRIKNNNKSN